MENYKNQSEKRTEEISEWTQHIAVKTFIELLNVWNCVKMHQKRNYSWQRQKVFLFVNASSPTTTHSLCYAASAQNFLYDVATGQWHYLQLHPVSRLCSKLQFRPSFYEYSPYRFRLQFIIMICTYSYKRSQNCEKRLLASKCQSVYPSVRQSAQNTLAPTKRTFMKTNI